MNLYRKSSKWMFSVPEGQRSRWQIILWWELRRIPYNLILGAVGICSIFLFYFFSSHEPIENGEDIGEPIMILIAPVLINACYMLGWIVEAYARRLISTVSPAIAARLARGFCGWEFSFRWR